MNALALILYVFAFVCFVLATFPPTQVQWNRLVSAGLAFWVAVYIFTSGASLINR